MVVKDPAIHQAKTHLDVLRSLSLVVPFIELPDLLVAEGERPCVHDFGTAFVHKNGFHPVNNWCFRTARQLDLNAWVKHKYHGFYRDASEEDRELLDYTWIEVLVRRLSGRPMDRLR